MLKPSRQNPKKTTGTELVGAFVTAWAARARAKGASKGVFVLDGAKVSDEELGSSTGLLPVFVLHADNLYKFGIRQSGIGTAFPEDEDALLRRGVNLDRISRSATEILLFVLEAVEDARQHLPRSEAVLGAVELRNLVNQFAAQMGIGPELAAADSAVSAKLQA